MGKFSPGLLVCLAFLSLELGCQRAEQGGQSSDRGSLDILSAEREGAGPGRAPELLKIQGVFGPSRTIKIKSEFNGRLENLAVAKGQMVSRQTPLFRVEDEGLAEHLESLRNQVQTAEGELEQVQSLAAIESPAEELPPESEVQALAEAPIDEAPLYREPTYFRMASEIAFTSEDAGGIWPGIDPKTIEVSHDAPDAGGIWPSYGAREMVNGEGPLSPWNNFFAAASVAVPDNIAEFTRVQSQILTQPASPVEIASESEESAAASPAEESRISLLQARIDRMRAEIAIAEKEWRDREILAPFDGRIDDLVASEGSPVQAGDFLVEIVQVNPIQFSFQIPKDQVDFLEVGAKVKGRLSDSSATTFEGEITYIGAELDPDRKAAEVRARVDNVDDALKAGMKASAEIEVGKGLAFF